MGIRKAHDLSTRGAASLALASSRHRRTENAAGMGPQGPWGAPWRGRAAACTRRAYRACALLMCTSAGWPGAAGTHQDTPTNTTRGTSGLCKVHGKVRKNEEAWSQRKHQGAKEELEEQLWSLHHKASVTQSFAQSPCLNAKLEGAQRSCHPLRLILKGSGSKT